MIAEKTEFTPSIIATVALAALIAIAAAGLPSLGGCAANQRETTIKAAMVSVDSARDGFLAYDRAHELSLVAHCDPAVDTKEQCAAKVDASNKALAAYQAKRAKIDPLFGAAYRAVAAAELLADDPSLTGMQAAIAQLIDALKPFLTSTGGK